MGAREPLKYSVSGGDVCTETLAQVRKATEEEDEDINNVPDDSMLGLGSEGEGDSGDLESTVNEAERGDGYDKGVVVRKTEVQDEATAVILENLRETGTRATVELASGIGKARLGARVVEALVQDGCLSRGGDGHDATGIVDVVVLVPTLTLIPKTIDEWHALMHERPGLTECMFECQVASVCSLPKLSQKELLELCGDEYEKYENEEVVKDKLKDKLKENEWPKEWRKVVDDPMTMWEWIMPRRDGTSSKPLVRLTVSTYHSASVVSKAFYQREKEPALTMFRIVDESESSKYSSGVNFERLLKDWQPHGDDLIGMTSERRLFMTEVSATSMDNENLYGKCVYRLPRVKAIELGLINQSMGHGEHSSQHEPRDDSYSDESNESENGDEDLGLDLFQPSESSSDDEEDEEDSEPPDLDSRRRARFARVTRLQERAARRLCRWFTDGFTEDEPGTWKRATLVLPCGAGKTRAPLPLLRDLFSESSQTTRAVRILVLAPGLQLLAQILEEWRANWEEVTQLPGLDVLTVCSDSNVHARGGEDGDAFEDNELDDAQRANLKVTSNPRDIEDHLLNPEASCVRVVLSTYQSSSIVQDACKRLSDTYQGQGKDSQGTFDIAIFDEAHRTVSSTRAKWASCYQIALQDHCKTVAGINIRRRLFLTATPRCPKVKGSPKGGKQDEDFELSTMDDDEIYGPHWVLKEKDAILDIENGKPGIVLPKKLIVGVVRKDACEEKLKQLMEQCQGDHERAEMLLKIASIDCAADDIAQEQGGVSALSFHHKVNDAKRFGTEFAGYSEGREPKWSVNHACAKTKIHKRTAMLKAMADNRMNNENARGLVTNVRALGEGVNSPSINLVVLDVNMRSAVSLGQATGRAARIEDDNPRKVFGYVLVLVMLADADVDELESTASQEREAWESPDTKECVSAVESGEARNEPRGKTPIGKKKHEREPHIQRLMKSGWEFKNTPGRGIGGMPPSAKKLWKKKKMPTLDEAVALQNSIDKSQSDEGQDELELRNGVKKLDFASPEVTKDTSARGTPTTSLRVAVARGGEDVGMTNQSQIPSADEPANLRGITKKLRVDGEHEEPEQLQDGLGKLQMDIPGDSYAVMTAVSTPISGSSGDVVSGGGVQRRAVGSNLLSTFDNVKVVLRALAEANPDIQEALGEVRSDTSRGFTNARDKLAKYVDVRDVTPFDPVQDGRNDTASPNAGGDARQRLEIEGVKELVRLHIERVCTTTWDTMYGLLLRWRDDPEKGNREHCNVPIGAEYKGELLGNWLAKQRGYKRNGKLYGDREAKLEELVQAKQLFLDHADDRWDLMYKLLLEWRDDPEKGNREHCNVPQDAEYKGEWLGSWLSDQRKYKKNGTLTLKGDREAKLEKLVQAKQLSWDATDDRWDTMYKLLLEWRDDPEKGNREHCNVPQGGKYKGELLGSWLNKQRKYKRNGTLTLKGDRVAKLEKLVQAKQLSWNPPKGGRRTGTYEMANFLPELASRTTTSITTTQGALHDRKK